MGRRYVPVVICICFSSHCSYCSYLVPIMSSIDMCLVAFHATSTVIPIAKMTSALHRTTEPTFPQRRKYIPS